MGLDWGGETGAVGKSEQGLMQIPLKSGATTGGRDTKLFLLFVWISLSTAVGGGGGGSEVRWAGTITCCAADRNMILGENDCSGTWASLMSKLGFLFRSLDSSMLVMGIGLFGKLATTYHKYTKIPNF